MEMDRGARPLQDYPQDGQDWWGDKPPDNVEILTQRKAYGIQEDWLGEPRYSGGPDRGRTIEKPWWKDARQQQGDAREGSGPAKHEEMDRSARPLQDYSQAGQDRPENEPLDNMETLILRKAYKIQEERRGEPRHLGGPDWGQNEELSNGDTLSQRMLTEEEQYQAQTEARPDAENGVMDGVSLVQSPTLMLLAFAPGMSVDQDPFDDGWEPIWFNMLVDEGFELQRGGHSMSMVIRLIRERIRAKDDARFEREVQGWVTGLARRWYLYDQTGMRMRWGVTEQDPCGELADTVVRQFRHQWLRLLCPEAMINRACEAARMENCCENASCSEEALHREWKESCDRSLSRSRTPQRRHASARGPKPMTSRPKTEEILSEDLECPDPALVLQRRHHVVQDEAAARLSQGRDLLREEAKSSQDGENPEPDEHALVVRKWLLKRKEGTYLRRLIDNPAAWNAGPGVTVTTSTRKLLSRRAKQSGSASSVAPRRCAAKKEDGVAEVDQPASSSQRPQNSEPTEDLDLQDASFQWRAILGWESDEDYEDAEPTRWPGFINDPTWSNVYESLMDMPESHVQQMAVALPETMRLIQQDLLAIVQQVSVDRGFALQSEDTAPETSAAPMASAPEDAARELDEEVEVEVQEEEGVDRAFSLQNEDPVPDTSAAPMSSAPEDAPQELDEEFEVEVLEEEGDETGLMQEATGAAANSPAADPDASGQRGQLQKRLLQLREELEQRWVAGHEVRHAVAAVRDIVTTTENEEIKEISLALLGQTAIVIPWKMEECRGGGMPLSPATWRWVEAVAEVIMQLARQAGKENEESSLMQRTLPGLLSNAARGEVTHAQELNDELVRLTEEEATTLAMKLTRAVTPYQTAVSQWGDIRAVLVAHTGRKGAIHCGARLAEQEQWVSRWFDKLVKPKREPSNHTGEERASSSHEAADRPPHENEEPLEDQEDRLLETQRKEDEALFDWHQQELAREAQIQDRAALSAHMGWSHRPPTKRLRVTMEVSTRTGNKYSEVEVGPGDSVNVKLSVGMVDHGHEYLKHGKRQDPRTAMEELREEEERIARGAVPAEDVSAGPVAFSTNDPVVRPLYEAWWQGRMDFAELQNKAGKDIAAFVVEAAEIADLDLETAPDISTQYREEWQKGRPVGELLQMVACQRDYQRWLEGDLRQDDVVNKWGGDVLRTYQAWAMERVVVREAAQEHVCREPECQVSDTHPDE